MKKTMKCVATFLLLLSICFICNEKKVFAAAEDNITAVTASGTESAVTVKGNTGTGVVAVIIEIFDESDNLVAMETHPVSGGAYEATLSIPLQAGKSYTAYVANYNGTGTPKEESFVPVKATTPEDGGTGTPIKKPTDTTAKTPAQTPAKSPKTGDAQEAGGLAGIVFLVSAMGIMFYRRKSA